MDNDDIEFGGFVKLYGDRLLGSSLLECDVTTRWVFVVMLAKSNADGYFRCATLNALARLANVTKGQAQRAVKELEAADPDSSSPEEDGRRILPARGGWKIVTYEQYRNRTSRALTGAERAKRFRDKRKSVTDRNGPSRSEPEAEAEAKAKAYTKADEEENVIITADGRKLPRRPEPKPLLVENRFHWDAEGKRIWADEKTRNELLSLWLEHGLTSDEFEAASRKLNRLISTGLEVVPLDPGYRLNKFLTEWLGNLEKDVRAPGLIGEPKYERPDPAADERAIAACARNHERERKKGRRHWYCPDSCGWSDLMPREQWNEGAKQEGTEE